MVFARAAASRALVSAAASRSSPSCFSPIACAAFFSATAAVPRPLRRVARRFGRRPRVGQLGCQALDLLGQRLLGRDDLLLLVSKSDPGRAPLRVKLHT